VHLKGNLDHVEGQIKIMKKRLVKENRFDKVLERFKSIRNYLKYLGVCEEDPSGNSGSLVFDFGLVLDKQLNFYSGLFFKLLSTIQTSV